MIDFYTWGTSNGRKVAIMLEETGLPYRVMPIDITKDEQFSDEFRRINPNTKIPTIVDHEPAAEYGAGPHTVIESGAILIYLGEKSGKFWPHDPRARSICLQWLMWQMGGVGPNFGQLHHFNRAAKEPVPYAIQRFTTEVERLYGVLDARLAKNAYMAGIDYSIADMATFPWVARYEWQKIDLARFPNVKRWHDAIWARPAVKRGFEIP